MRGSFESAIRMENTEKRKRGRPSISASARKMRRVADEKKRRAKLVNIGTQRDRWERLRSESGHETHESFADALLSRKWNHTDGQYAAKKGITMRKTNAERQREYRARRNADPERREAYLGSERERWKRDTEAGKKKPIKDLSIRAKQHKRKMWRRAKQKQKMREQEALGNLNSTPRSPLGQHAEQPKSGSSSYENMLTSAGSGSCTQGATALSSHGGLSASRSVIEMEVTIDEDEGNNMKNKLLIQSELLMKCEEEELELCQKQTSHVHVKQEEEDEEWNMVHQTTEEHVDGTNQTDYKADPLLQRDAISSLPPEVKTETPQLVVFNNQVPGVAVTSPQLTNDMKFIGFLGAQSCPLSSLRTVPGQTAQEPLVQKESIQTVKPKDSDQISSNSVLIKCPESPSLYPHSDQPQSDQSSSQILPVPVSLPCFTILELESTDTPNKPY